MTSDNNFEAQYIGKISEGILGELDLYIADLPSTVDAIHDLRVSNDETTGDGVDEFYFLATGTQFGTKGSAETKSGTAVFTPAKMGEEPIVLWKAYYHYVGKFFEIARPDDVEIQGHFETDVLGWFTLPKIPAVMISHLDQFFRAIDDKHHTEAIVLLTYDFDFRHGDSPEQGWGFGVPDQKNNSVHCDYNKQNVIESLSSSTKIVGTVHSHPGMPAYASGTDHNDQAGFDGLHITFGWQKSKGDSTEYHAELTRGNTFYSVAPDVVMDFTQLLVYEVEINGETYQIEESNLKPVELQYTVDEKDLDAWSDKVQKSYSGTHYGSVGTGGGSPKALAPHRGPRDTSEFLPGRLPKPDGILEFGIKDVPDARKNNIFVTINRDATRCPMCSITWKTFTELVHQRRQCLNCAVFFVYENEEIPNVDKCRQELGFTPFHDFIDAYKPFVIWDNNKLTWKAFDYMFVDEKLQFVGDVPKKALS